jgi:type IV pilus assembly protein PilP
MMYFRLGTAAALLVVITSLTGCGDGDTQEIQEWMNQVKRDAKVTVKPVPPPTQFSPFVYEAQAIVDPFHPDKLEVIFAKAKASTSSGNGIKAPDMDRRKELLESYPLDAVKMVGALNKRGMTFAVLQIDGAVHQAKVGNYVGTNFGMITHIDENAVHVKEVVQDASGEWVERDAKLELQEAQK